jgi:hypothetical protein
VLLGSFQSSLISPPMILLWVSSYFLWSSYNCELNEHINYVGKGVDKYDPILPICMPRGYGGVAILWKKAILSSIMFMLRYGV